MCSISKINNLGKISTQQPLRRMLNWLILAEKLHNNVQSDEDINSALVLLHLSLDFNYLEHINVRRSPQLLPARATNTHSITSKTLNSQK